MSNTPAATRALRILQYLASAGGPVHASALARELGLPRSSAYHLLQAMAEQGFVTHFPEEERWGLGVAAFEVGAAYLRHDPMERLARPLLADLVQRAKSVAPTVAHLGILHGRETLYLLKEFAPGSLTVVTDVGVRLPASLTASGRAILAQLPAAQVRAIFPSHVGFVDRTGLGPQSLPALQRLLSIERGRGYAEEDGFVTDGFASVALPVRDHLGHPVAAIGVTFESHLVSDDRRAKLAQLATRTARELSRRLGARVV